MSWLYNAIFLMQTGAAEAVQTGTDAAAPATEGGGTGGLMSCGSGAGGIEFLVWMVFLFGLMYFLLIRPQKKQQQKHQQMISSLKKGDRVLTSGGILGTIKAIADPIIYLDVADGVTIKIRKEHVGGLQTEANEKKDEADKK